jgi:hypothetical protein
MVVERMAAMPDCHTRPRLQGGESHGGSSAKAGPHGTGQDKHQMLEVRRPPIKKGSQPEHGSSLYGMAGDWQSQEHPCPQEDDFSRGQGDFAPGLAAAHSRKIHRSWKPVGPTPPGRLGWVNNPIYSDGKQKRTSPTDDRARLPERGQGLRSAAPGLIHRA